LILYAFAVAVDKRPKWFLSKKLLECRKVEEKYERLVSSRKDLIHHYYWAKSENERKKMKDLKVDIDRMYQEILDLKGSYDQIKKGLPVPLRTMA
jgi:hypothetical protein